MLLITFNIAEDRYALDTRNVIEIVPQVTLKSIPMEESYVAGIFNYHGNYVPVIDISSLCGGTVASASLTTRIIIARFNDKQVIGLLADNLTQTLHIEPEQFSSCGIQKLNADFLGDVSHHEDGLIQLVNIEQLLSPELKSRLYETVGAA